ncbi:MAG: hypothetical protein ACOZBL_01235 [Patescibacteria group bacterium]
MPANGGSTKINCIKSNGKTLFVLWVNCSILAFTFHSATSHIQDFIIQYNRQINFAISSMILISGINAGILGAGGNSGRSKSIVGKNEGKTGNSGSSGNNGIAGKVKSKDIPSPNFGGFGRSGILGKLNAIGAKVNFGRTISIPKSI